MAELIPFEYRFEGIRRKLVGRWVLTAVLSLAVSASLLAFTYSWQHKREEEFAQCSQEFREKSAFMAKAKELQARRVELAARMQKMQELKDDKILLSLLRNVSDAFSTNDCLEFISVMAHNTVRGSTDADDHKYSVHVVGITKTDTTHADLLNRLTEIGAKADPALATTPESLKLIPMLDGKVMKFEILCDKPDGKRG